MTLNEFMEVQLDPFSGDFNNSTTDAGCMVLVGGIKDTDRDTAVTLDIPHLLMAFDGVDQDVGSISIDPGLHHVRRAVGHDRRKKVDHPLLQQVLEFFWKHDHLFPSLFSSRACQYLVITKRK
jgi:hypothetical protein